jgi:cytochrome c-type biogenesis protein CcmF
MDSGLTRDLYVSLGEPVGDGAWIVRIYHKPFVDWIWGGAFIMAIGGLVALTDRRYRIARREERSTNAAAVRPAAA